MPNKINNRKLTTTQSLNAYIKGICDIMRRAGQVGLVLKVDLWYFL